MLSDALTRASKVTISTGNVLNLIDIKKKAGQNVTEELTESLKITIAEWENSHNSIKNATPPNNDILPAKKGTVVVSRSHDDVRTKMSEDDRKNLKIGVKIFVNDDSVESLTECLDSVYKTLNIDMIENVVLAYNPPHPASELVNGGGKHAGGSSGDSDAADGKGTNESDSSKCDHILPGLKVLWSTLQEYVKKGSIVQLGVSDLDEACFKRLHETSEVKPSIVQINLSSCCVVPPGLQKFCKDNDIQLLTHSDPQEIISKETLSSVLEGRPSIMKWCVRYQVHIKCRGVLSLKGFITNAALESQ